MSTSAASASTSSTITRGKWSVVGTIVSAPIRGYYYPGKVIAIKKSIIDQPVPHNNNQANGGSSSSSSTQGSNTSNNQNNNTPIATVSPLIYSIQFSDPLDASPLEMDNSNLSETNNKIDSKRQQDQGLIKDYNADQLIGRGFEPITRALLSENQKVFITYRSRECSAHVIKHDTVLDDVTLLIDHPPNSTTTTINGGGFGDLTSLSSSSLSNNHHLNGGGGELRTVKLNEIRLLPSRKSGRIQEPPDYSLLANNGRRSPDEEYSNVAKLSSSLNSNSITNGSMSSSSSLSSSTTNAASTKNNNRRQRTVSGSSILANHDNLTTSSSIFANNNGPTKTMMHSQSAHIDVPQQRRLPTSYQQQQQNNAHITLPGRKRRPTTAAAATSVAATTASTFYNNNNNNNTAGSISTSSSFTDHHQNVSTADVVMSGPMDECTAALVLMSLSAPPRSPTLFNQTEPKRATKLYKCTWPGCKHQTYSSKEIQQHVRFAHKQNDDEEMESGEEDFYYTEVDASEPIGFFNHPNMAAAFNHHHHHNHHHQLSSGPESPVSLSEADAASSSSSSSQLMMTIGDNSMDSSSNPPSPITTLMAQQQQQQLQNHQQFNQSAATFMPLQNKYRHLEDHEYNRKPDPAGISLLGTGTVVSNRRGRKSNLNQNGVSIITPTAHHQTTIISSHPINIPNMEQHHDNTSQSPISGSASFGTGGMIGGFNSAASSLSSGFGSYTSSLGSSFSPISPTRSHSGSLSSSASGKYARISNAFIAATNGGGGGRSNGSINGGTPLSSSQSSTASSHHHHNNVQQPNRTSPTKRVRGETRKCRKVYGMEKKDSWCTQCKWKKACSRFTD